MQGRKQARLSSRQTREPMRDRSQDVDSLLEGILVIVLVLVVAAAWLLRYRDDRINVPWKVGPVLINHKS